VTLREFGLFFVSILMSVLGQFFLKTGATKLGKADVYNAVAQVLGIIRTPELLLGLALYGGSAILYILLLTRINLSVIAPSVSLSYIFSVLMGYFLFHESITGRHLIGMGLITCGVVLVVWKKST
jgi:drug/metabolite transporter (DMT)-like permease